jgi:hypothetical protein
MVKKENTGTMNIGIYTATDRNPERANEKPSYSQLTTNNKISFTGYLAIY